MMQTLFDWTVQGRISPHVSHCHPLAQYREAMAALHARESRGKVVLEIGR
jgi:NADPH2:quinone reductase